MSTVEVVEYDREWADAQARFALGEWPRKVRRRDPGYLRWKFRGPASGPVPGLILAVADGEVRGQMGLLPATARFGPGQDPVPCQWICDVMVSSAHRRQGIVKALGTAALARPMVSMATDPSEGAGRAFDRLGMGLHHPASIMVLPVKLGPVVATRYPQAARASRLITAAGAPPMRLLHRRLAAAARTPGTAVCAWPDVVDLVEARDAASPLPHVVHDAEFLAWRSAGLDGWVREQEAVRTARGSFALTERRDGGLAVADWHAVDDDDALALFGRVSYLAAAYGVDFVEAFASGPAVDQLAALGFRARRSRLELWSHPADIIADDAFAFTGHDSDFGL